MRVCVRAVIPFRFFAVRGGGAEKKLEKQNTVVKPQHDFPDGKSKRYSFFVPSTTILLLLLLLLLLLHTYYTTTDGPLFFARQRGGHLFGTTPSLGVCKVHPPSDTGDWRHPSIVYIIIVSIVLRYVLPVVSCGGRRRKHYLNTKKIKSSKSSEKNSLSV
uniref:Transmembrane protein n=1 Tax=Schizaphis graminum TaxID=13262 RepID=A0A2S2NT87_SCHGA